MSSRKNKSKHQIPQLDNKLYLTKYGYSVQKSPTSRQRALLAASNNHNPLTILRRLQLIRDHQHIPENKKVFANDISYLKKLYRDTEYDDMNIMKYMRIEDRWDQGGGSKSLVDEMAESTIESDVINGMEVDSPSVIEINTVIDREKVCDAEGKCGVRNVVREIHRVDDKEVEFYTLNETDADAILNLDKKYLDRNKTTIDDIISKIQSNRGLLIGIKVDFIFRGYFWYDISEDLEATIVEFIADQGYRTPLYQFAEAYFRRSDYNRIKLTLNRKASDFDQSYEFWKRMGFNIDNTMIDSKDKIHMFKNIN